MLHGLNQCSPLFHCIHANKFQSSLFLITPYLLASCQQHMLAAGIGIVSIPGQVTSYMKILTHGGFPVYLPPAHAQNCQCWLIIINCISYLQCSRTLPLLATSTCVELLVLADRYLLYFLLTVFSNTPSACHQYCSPLATCCFCCCCCSRCFPGCLPYCGCACTRAVATTLNRISRLI